MLLVNVSRYLIAFCAGFVLLAAPSGPLAAQAPTPTPFSPCSPRLLTVQAPPASAVAVDGGFSITPAYLASLDDAQAQYDFPLLLPMDIPDGYQLGTIGYLHPQPGVPPMDLLMVCYLASDGGYLQVTQGYPLPVGGTTGTAYAYTPGDEKGTTTVQGKDAYWKLGRLLGGGAPQFWQPGALQLAWNTDISVPLPAGAFYIPPGATEPQPLPPLYIGYQLESDTLSLDELVAIGNSVQPYTADPGP